MSSIIVNLQNYIDLSKERHRVHQKEALFWDKVNTYANISLIILTSIATVLSVLEGSIPFYIVPIFTGLATIISSLIGVFKPFDKRNVQEDSSKKFKILSLKLVACKSMKDYNELRAEILETMMDQPFTRVKKKRGNKNKQAGKDGPISIKDEESFDKEDIEKGNHDYQVKQKAKPTMVQEKSLDDDRKLWNLDPEMRKAAIIEEIKFKTFEYNLLNPRRKQIKKHSWRRPKKEASFVPEQYINPREESQEQGSSELDMEESGLNQEQQTEDEGTKSEFDGSEYTEQQDSAYSNCDSDDNGDSCNGIVQPWQEISEDDDVNVEINNATGNLPKSLMNSIIETGCRLAASVRAPSPPALLPPKLMMERIVRPDHRVKCSKTVSTHHINTTSLDSESDIESVQSKDTVNTEMDKVQCSIAKSYDEGIINRDRTTAQSPMQSEIEVDSDSDDEAVQSKDEAIVPLPKPMMRSIINKDYRITCSKQPKTPPLASLRPLRVKK